MATISIDTDLRKAVDNGWMTHAEAWEAADLRKQRAALNRQLAPLTKKVGEIEAKIAATSERHLELENLADPAYWAERDAGTATEPEQGEGE